MKIISLWTTDFLEKNKIPFYFQERAESSNDLAKAKAFQNLLNPYLILVDHQIKGRGSNNRRWQDSDLMLSFLWHKEDVLIEPQICEDFTRDIQKALKLAWQELELSFKAPNDLYLEDKKLAGLLLEVLNQGSQTVFILGLGLNVFSIPKKLTGDNTLNSSKDFSAACLKDQVKDLTQESWQIFLSSLIGNWSSQFLNL